MPRRLLCQGDLALENSIKEAFPRTVDRLGYPQPFFIRTYAVCANGLFKMTSGLLRPPN